MSIVDKALSKFSIRKASLNKIVYFAADWIAVVIALKLAMVIRFLDDQPTPQRHIDHANQYLPVFLVTTVLVFYFLQIYRQLWQYASVSQYISLLAGSVIQTVVVALIMVITRVRLPWSVYILYTLLLLALISGYRILYRQYFRYKLMLKKRQAFKDTENEQLTGESAYLAQIRRVLIYGAGQAGFEVIRDLQENSRGKVPVVILDDNKAVHQHRILGVPVFGGRDQFAEAVEAFQVDLIVIAIPSAPGHIIRKIIDSAQATGCEIKVLPNLYELYDSKPTFAKTRDVEISDLLGRREIHLDLPAIQESLAGKTVLVTGGGGSIGSELCRQIARFGPGKIAILDVYENSAYLLANELRMVFGDKLAVDVLIGSVRDPDRIRAVFEQVRPDLVFHAAAHKHVPLMEASPSEAIRNNVLGTYLTASQAGRSGTSRFILISTDKAAEPVNVMGASKRLSELVIQSLASQFPNTCFAAVRFGNVLGSSGSVIPLFENQMKYQQKILITHPDIARSFMTAPEAVSLILQTGVLAQSGKVYLLDLGQPMKIVDLARELIRLKGFEPDVDIKIEFTGLRPGEQLDEKLSVDPGCLETTANPHIFALKFIGDLIHTYPVVDRLRGQIQTLAPDVARLIDQALEQAASTNDSCSGKNP